jgi:hypothetical protein
MSYASGLQSSQDPIGIAAFVPVCLPRCFRPRSRLRASSSFAVLPPMLARIVDWMATRSDRSSWALSRRVVFPFILIIIFTVSTVAHAQSTLTPMEQQAVLAFNPNAKTFSTLTFSGTAAWTAGSLQDSGNVVLTASADGSSNETWSLSSQPHTLASTPFTSGRSCSYVDSAGKNHQDASSECFRAVPWFAPWMSLLMLPNNVLLRTSGVSLAAADGTTAQLQYMTNLGTAATPNPQLAAFSSGTVIGLVVDPKTSLINEVDFNQTIDSDTARVIPYRIVFSDYRPEAGLILPHHIQRYIQRTLQTDITITNITAE